MPPRGEPDGVALVGTIFDIQRFSFHDGPGIRSTVFLKGCPLSCSWCHNPEGISPEPEILVIPGRCISCEECLAACPHPPRTLPGGRRRSDPALCTRCGRCVAACPTGARRLVGEDLTVAELMTRVERDRPFFEESGGGVTFSGGEPLLQVEFLLACLAECARCGLHTAVDTSGCGAQDTVLEAGRQADLILYDLKTVDDARHREQTGAAVGPILENLAALDAAGATLWVRVPLIPGFNDDADSLEGIGRHIASLQRTRRVHLLPYHRWGAAKRERWAGESGKRGPWAEEAGKAGDARRDPDPDLVRVVQRRLRALGLDVRIGG